MEVFKNPKERQQRNDEFAKILESIPGKTAEKQRIIADMLNVSLMTVRIWSCPSIERVIPERHLRLLRKQLVDIHPRPEGRGFPRNSGKI